MYYSSDGKIRITERKEIALHQSQRFSLRISNDFGFIEKVSLILQKYCSEERREIALKYVSTSKNNESSFVSEPFVFHQSPGLYFYCYSLQTNHQQYYLKNGTSGVELTTYDLPWWQFTVTFKRFEVPTWAKGAIIMHIMVDRFAKDTSLSVETLPRRVIREDWDGLPVWRPNEKGEVTNTDFFCGNLRGITKHLKYIRKLGVTIVYLSPILKSQSNHRYDTADYFMIDPYLGDESDMKQLCDVAHSLGMKVMIDTVLNHTGDDSIYFNRYHSFPEKGAVDGPDSPYYKWYKKDEHQNFLYWWDFKNLPVCDPACREWQNFLFGKDGAISTWFSWGIDGLRIDVADELPDWFLEKLATCVKKNKKDAFLMGEVWKNAIRINEGHRNYLLGTSLHTVMNYQFTEACLQYVRFRDVQKFIYHISQVTSDYPSQACLSAMNALSTHDIPRAITSLGGEGFEPNQYEWVWDIGEKNRQWQAEKDTLSRSAYKKARERLKAALCILYFLPGNPSIFYGDEVGLHGYKDPFNRKTYPWKRRDKKLLQFYRKLGKVFRNLPILKKAKLNLVDVNERYLFFERTFKKAHVFVAVNITEHQQKIVIPKKYSQDKMFFSVNKSDRNTLNPYGCIVLTNC